jgi:hypothetical protein
MNERRLNGRRRIYLTYQIRLSFVIIIIIIIIIIFPQAIAAIGCMEPPSDCPLVARAPCGLASSLSHHLERSWSRLGCHPIDKHQSMSTSSYGGALAQVPTSDFLVYLATSVLEPVLLPLYCCTGVEVCSAWRSINALQV